MELGLMVAGVLLGAAALAAAALIIVSNKGAQPVEAEPVQATSGLAELGYLKVAEHKWTKSIRGIKLDFDDEEGWKWTAQLPRYGVLQLRIVEREGRGMSSFGQGTFLTQDPDLDRRFVVSSDRPSHTLGLLCDQTVKRLLLKLPHVNLELHGDELVIYDEKQDNFRHLCTATGRSEREAEAQVHDHINRIVVSVLRVLYESSPSVVLEAL
ncbi:MAG: hypothetical protein KTR31_06815 [Myxococcales bacterium]|nr:hypothetical protein [Myxococcales bacterium]